MWGYGPYGGGMMGGYAGWPVGGWGMLLGGVLWFVLLALAVAALAWILRGGHGIHHHHLGPWRSSGLDVLEERYARGEIGRDEYLQKKRDMLGRGGT